MTTGEDAVVGLAAGGIPTVPMFRISVLVAGVFVLHSSPRRSCLVLFDPCVGVDVSDG